jgi:hypothetical protein
MRFQLSRQQIVEKISELVTAETRIPGLIAELRAQGGLGEEVISKMLTRAGASSEVVENFLVKYRSAK